jgi:uncharacterized protein
MSQFTGFLIFFSLVTSVYAAAHYYLFTWFVRWAKPPKRIEKIVFVAFCLLVISFPLSRVLSWRDFNHFTYLLMLAASVWMGLVLYLIIFSLASDLGLIFARLFGAKRRSGERGFLKFRRLLFGMILAVTVSIGGCALYEARRVGVSNLEIPLAGLPKELEGLTIAHLSDVHFGVLNNTGKLERLVALTNSLNPDLIVITGDWVDESVAHMEDMAGPLKKLRGKKGVYAITGNHDYYAGVDRAVGIMREAGIEVLRNEIRILPGGLQLLGIDDPTGARRMGDVAADFAAIVSRADPSKPSILLYHQPIHFEKAARAGIGLQLSGHTHGGQLYPVIHISKRIYPRTPGLHRLEKSFLYVNRGAGTWGPPMRFLSPPEIALIRLVFGGE